MASKATRARVEAQLSNSRRRPGKGAVPVLGTGLNIQASAIEGCGPSDDWAALLTAIAEDIGWSRDEQSRLPSSFLARWEQLLVGWAVRNSVAPHRAEDQLQMRIVRRLRSLEAETGAYRLYSEIAHAGISDIISLNFDRRIALAAPREWFDTGPPNAPEGPSSGALYRHSRLIVGDGCVTRVWYPHGDTRRADTLKLGVRRYGMHLGLIREHLGLETPAWRLNVMWEDLLEGEEGDAEDCESWVEVFLTRPLLFVGCGLAPDEWSLWWLLRYRAALDPPPAYFLHAGPCDPYITSFGRSAGLLPVPFGSFDELWDTNPDGSRVAGDLR